MQFFFIMTMLCVFFSGCFSPDHASREQYPWVYPSEFVKPGKFSPDYHRLKDQFDWYFKSEDLAWEKEKNIFYVVFYDSVKYIMSLPLDSSEVEIYKLFSIEDIEHLAETRSDFEDCVEKHVKNKSSMVYNLCKKKKTMPQTLIEKMKFFLLEEKLSVQSWSTQCRGALHMFYYDGAKYYYFDMKNPEGFDLGIKKDPRIPEYIEFYNEMAAFITQDFGACRWDNFGNRDEMIRECGKFNWRWREKYPDLVK